VAISTSKPNITNYIVVEALAALYATVLSRDLEFITMKEIRVDIVRQLKMQ
jgi:hypothetical protein